jgi:hypothetical protein
MTHPPSTLNPRMLKYVRPHHSIMIFLFKSEEMLGVNAHRQKIQNTISVIEKIQSDGRICLMYMESSYYALAPASGAAAGAPKKVHPQAL